MQKTINKVTRLTNFLYEYFSLDHHKDRDCHFEIVQSWDYDEKPKWQIRHYGYIFEEIEEYCDTYEDALKGLSVFLVSSIDKEKDWAKDVLKNPKNWNDYQIKKAKKIQEILI